MSERPECTGTERLIPELAIGVAAGDERARALRHLAGCAYCRSDLESTTAVADGLLLLAPEREPPPGFEARVMAVLAPGTPRRSRLRTVLMQAAAAVTIAALGAGAVWWRTAEDRELATGYRQALAVAHGQYLRAAPMLAEGASRVGHMFAYQGSPSWIFVVVQNSNGSGTYAVRLTTRDGRRITLGMMTIKRGRGSWGTAISEPVYQILVINLVGPQGLEMSARFDNS